jgi:hypothetical protein
MGVDVATDVLSVVYIRQPKTYIRGTFQHIIVNKRVLLSIQACYYYTMIDIVSPDKD